MPTPITLQHHQALAKAAADLMATSPDRAKIERFAASLPVQAKGVISAATYNHQLHRLEIVAAHGGLRFPLPLPEAPKPKAAPASEARFEADAHRDGAVVTHNPDGSTTATIPAPVGG